jgi:hypothetical protein
MVTIDDIYKANINDIEIGENYSHNDDFTNDKLGLFKGLIFKEHFSVDVTCFKDYQKRHRTILVQNDAFVIFSLNLYK